MDRAGNFVIAWIGGAFDSDDSDEPTTTLPLETLPPATTVAASIPVSAAPPIPATTAAP